MQEQNGTVVSNTMMTKRQAVKIAVAQLGKEASSQMIQEYCRQNLGVEVPLSTAQVYKTTEVRQQTKTPPNPTINMKPRSNSKTGEHHIHRVESENAYTFKHRAGNQNFQKRFSDHVFGSPEASLAAAVNFRDEYFGSKTETTPKQKVKAQTQPTTKQGQNTRPHQTALNNTTKDQLDHLTELAGIGGRGTADAVRFAVFVVGQCDPTELKQLGMFYQLVEEYGEEKGRRIMDVIRS